MSWLLDYSITHSLSCLSSPGLFQRQAERKLHFFAELFLYYATDGGCGAGGDAELDAVLLTGDAAASKT